MTAPPMAAPRGTIVVLRSLGLGDILTAVPALRGIARAWPRHELQVLAPGGLADLVTAAVPRARVIPADRLTSTSLPVERPALAINLHGRGPASNRELMRLSPGWLLAFRDHRTATPGPEWRADEHEVDRWCRLVDAGGACSDPGDLALPTRPLHRAGRPTVVVHPGAASASRRWRPGGFAAVARALHDRGCRIVVTGTRDERTRCARVVAAAERPMLDLCGRLDAWELAHQVARAQLVVCGDTGIAHLAHAVATPSVELFGPLSPALWGLRGSRRHRGIWHGDPGILRPGDPAGAHIDPRLASITTAEVLEVAECLLDSFAGEPLRVPVRVGRRSVAHDDVTRLSAVTPRTITTTPATWRRPSLSLKST